MGKSPSNKLNPPFPVFRDWIDDDGRFLLGQFKGSRVEAIAKSAPKYIQWILDNITLSDEERGIMQTLLDRRG